MIFKILMWILRLLSWPWAERGSIGWWSAAPHEQLPSDNGGHERPAPRVCGIRMG